MAKSKIEKLEDVIADIYDRVDSSYKLALEEREHEVANETAYATVILNEIIKRTGIKLFYPNKWRLVYTASDCPKFEVICPHGVGHHKGVHGCHMSKIHKNKSCCTDCPPELWKKVTKDK